MRKNITKSFILLFVAIAFAGCSAKQSEEHYFTMYQTSKHFSQTLQIQASKTKNVLGVDFDTITKLLTTNSITYSKLFSQVLENNADFTLVFHIVEINALTMGFAKGVSSSVEIAWILLKNDNVIFKKSITSSVGSNLVHNIQRNIELILQEISRLDLDNYKILLGSSAHDLLKSSNLSAHDLLKSSNL